MGNNGFQIPEYLEKEWFTYSENDSQIYQNKLTKQAFKLFIISTKNEQNKLFSYLMERSIYPLPNTPKIIVLNNYQGYLYALVQQSTHLPSEFIPKITLKLQLLQKIMQTCTVACQLLGRYGNYYLTQKMLGIDDNNRIILWINEHKQKYTVQYQYKAKSGIQNFLIHQILGIYKKYTRFRIDQIFNSQVQLNFKEFENRIKYLINRQKQEILNLSLSEKDIRNHRKHFSPQFNSNQNSLNHTFSRQTFTNTRIQNPKKYKIPHFLSKKTSNKNIIGQEQSESAQKNKLNFNSSKLSKFRDPKPIVYQNSSINKVNKVKSLTNLTFQGQEKIPSQFQFHKKHLQESAETREPLTASQKWIPNDSNHQKNIKIPEYNKLSHRRNKNEGYGKINDVFTSKQQSYLFNSSHKRNQITSLQSLCQKFRVSQLVNDSFELKRCQQKDESLLIESMLNKRPVTFTEESEMNNFQQQFSKIIGV